MLLALCSFIKHHHITSDFFGAGLDMSNLSSIILKIMQSVSDNNTSSSSASSSRWVPPTSGAQGGRISNRPSSNNNDDARDARNANYQRDAQHQGGGGGVEECRQGGGKISRQRRHNSHDAHNQRNPHRVPRTQQQQQQQQRRIIVTPDVENPTANSTSAAAAINEDVPKLDPTDPVHAKRIHQRRRQVLFGKNTAGYEEYVKQIPKHKRKQRSLDCPTTPDYTVDIPTKRWQGLMNAWRRSLHTFDPADLHLHTISSQPTNITLAPRPCMTEDDIQEEQIVQAKASGLQVAFGTMNVGQESAMFAFQVAAEESMVNNDCGDDTTRAMGEGFVKKEEIMPLFDEEAAYQQQTIDGRGLGDLKEGDDSDSDDDLL